MGKAVDHGRTAVVAHFFFVAMVSRVGARRGVCWTGSADRHAGNPPTSLLEIIAFSLRARRATGPFALKRTLGWRLFRLRRLLLPTLSFSGASCLAQPNTKDTQQVLASTSSLCCSALILRRGEQTVTPGWWRRRARLSWFLSSRGRR